MWTGKRGFDESENVVENHVNEFVHKYIYICISESECLSRNVFCNVIFEEVSISMIVFLILNCNGMILRSIWSDLWKNEFVIRNFLWDNSIWIVDNQVGALSMYQLYWTLVAMHFSLILNQTFDFPQTACSTSCSFNEILFIFSLELNIRLDGFR
jgi:hypothetical protein